MNRYLLLILLSSWSLLVTLSSQCDTGVAKPSRVLSVPKSLMANADVAILRKYSAKTVEKCLEDCCVKKYGGCNVASFKKSSTKENCLHFYCLPTNKCVFASSNTTDSFSFSSESHKTLPVPFSNAHINSTRTPMNTSPLKQLKQPISIEQQMIDHEQTKEKLATFSEEQFAMKNDNTTIKPRKGVENIMMDDSVEENTTMRSGIKPRKGVNMEDAPELRNASKAVISKVKPRKGVGNFTLTDAPVDISSTHLANKHIVSTQLNKNTQIVSQYHSKVYSQDVNLSSDLISALEKVFEDDPSVSNMTSTSTEHSQTVIIIPSSAQYVAESTTGSDIYAPSSSGVNSFSLQSSLHYEIEQSKQSSSQTPLLEKSTSLSMSTTRYFDYTLMPSIPSSLPVEATTTLEFLEDDVLISPSSLGLDDTVEESENERKYKSSMHLVLSLVFGLLVLFAVLGVVAKRIYDGWLRRHYRRMDFLIDGMYNGYE